MSTVKFIQKIYSTVFSHNNKKYAEYLMCSLPRSNSIALDDIIRWDLWLDSKEYLTLNGYVRSGSRYIHNPMRINLSPFCIRTASQWNGKLTDITGIANSKSELSKFISIEEFALNNCGELINNEYTANNIERLMNHSQIRLFDKFKEPLFSFSWADKLYLCNSGGSHHFAAAYYIAKKINYDVTLKLELVHHALNPTALIKLQSQFYMIVLDSLENGRYHFENEMERKRIDYYIYSLPKPVTHLSLILLPKNNILSANVFISAIRFGAFDFGQYIAKIAKI